MPVASGRRAPIVCGGESFRRHRARAEIDEIEPATGAEDLEQGRPEPIGAEDRRDRQPAPGDVADEMAADEPRA